MANELKKDQIHLLLVIIILMVNTESIHIYFYRVLRRTLIHIKRFINSLFTKIKKDEMTVDLR